MARKITDQYVQKRLDRELFRMRFGSWYALGWIGALVAFLLLVAVKIPTQTQFLTGEISGYRTVETEAGPDQQVIVFWNDRNRTAGTSSRFTTPPIGEIVCLRETTYWPFGDRALNVVDMRRCNNKQPG